MPWKPVRYIRTERTVPSALAPAGLPTSSLPPHWPHAYRLGPVGNPERAYGIPQADPGSKMAAEGSDWRTNPQTQIRWGEDYIQSRYGRPCQAWTFWQARAYYGPLLAVMPF